ncbi:hypothetical protein [Sphingomonas pruni]|uniref:hypothetical protein n=1 Tax=Sphingomonas pruni TaxID=40683 RepID=UPI000A753308|nr:hypothetical protein [Sphingomonas pruni]
MTFNLLLWKWSDDFDTPSKRRKHALKMGHVTAQFAKTGDHPAIGDADVHSFRLAIDAEFGQNEDDRPFAFEDYGKCAVINYPNAVRFDLVPRVAGIGKRFGLNASEF